MYKMVVSDFFGTLIDKEEAIPLSTMLELDRIRKDGVLFTITTSKSVKRIIEYNRDFPFIDYIVAFNGSYVYDLNKEKVLYKKGISISVIKKIMKMFSGKDFSFYTELSCNYTGNHKDEYYSEPLIDVSEFLNENKKNIYKMKVYFDSLKEARKARGKLEDNLISSYIKQEEYYYVLEITNNTDSKLSGLIRILLMKKFDLEDVLAICSSESSLGLVSKVGKGIRVSNSDSILIKRGIEVTSSNEEKGVEEVLKKYF